MALSSGTGVGGRVTVSEGDAGGLRRPCVSDQVGNVIRGVSWWYK
ncbi:hypothetical protein E2C01_070012 [Portunus trituberculatus]|uniref:Uncharacterized protein n=1 Tax=Portunus trituberculatus TaxID=210409 RepID=A0A5B7HT43_PORTR|nr:hypothetical protein [Portunus trituberculatus]